MDRCLSRQWLELGSTHICSGVGGSNGTMGQEEGAALPQRVWGQIQEEEVHNAPWYLVDPGVETRSVASSIVNIEAFVLFLLIV